MKDEILVSICCLTYNQEKYIKDALEGFLMQKTNFKYEIIIHDDASNDNTANIIREYEEKYPNIIKPIYQKENQYSQGKWSLITTFNNAKGKYIALCEGDDYWIDENKLQLQVDYMEKNPNCTLLFHNAKIIDMLNNKESNFVPYNKVAKKYIKKDGNYNVGELELIEFIPTASYMFRRRYVMDIPEWFENCFVQDWPLRLILTSFGYAHFVDKKMCIYRKNAQGSVTVENTNKGNESNKGMLEILDKKKFCVTKIDEFTDYKYHDIFEKRLLQYEVEKLFYTGKGKEIIKKRYVKYIPEKRIRFILKIYFPSIMKTLKMIKEKIKKV